jgi:putative addiction module component (TIGR02574 family)
MPRSLDEIFQLAMELPIGQRAELASSLLNSLDQEDEDVDEAWKAEIKRRLDEIDSGTIELIPMDVVLAKMKARLER